MWEMCLHSLKSNERMHSCAHPTGLGSTTQPVRGSSTSTSITPSLPLAQITTIPSPNQPLAFPDSFVNYVGSLCQILPRSGAWTVWQRLVRKGWLCRCKRKVCRRRFWLYCGFSLPVRQELYLETPGSKGETRFITTGAPAGCCGLGTRSPTRISSWRMGLLDSLHLSPPRATHGLRSRAE